jgi:hypothetical protein
MAHRNSLEEFHRKFGIISFQRTMPEPIKVETMSGRAYQYACNDAVVATLELPLERFFDLVTVTDEFEQLAQDPATSELIKEAKIIYKLKHGV